MKRMQQTHFNMMPRGLLFLAIVANSHTSNNVCNNFESYHHPDDGNCYYDPDTTLEAPEIIAKYSGVVETHSLTTKDGYILNMFRIPVTNPRGVILLHHSIFFSSRIFLWQGNNSLAITLWRNGFDVWLANHRGTSYSNRHINMTSANDKYWDFSAHEIAIYDLSSEVELIREKTENSQIIFLGHSLGATAGLIYSSLKPEDARNYLKTMVLLATPCYFEHAESQILFTKPFVPALHSFFRNTWHTNSPLGLRQILIPISRIIFHQCPSLIQRLSDISMLIYGYAPNETDPRFFNYDSVMSVDNFSWKTFTHLLQLIDRKNRFQNFDYGEVKNLRMYGTKEAPSYPMEQTSVPTLLVSGSSDSLTTTKDTDALFQKLSKGTKCEHWKIEEFNHLTFIVGLDRVEKLQNRLLKFIVNLTV